VSGCGERRVWKISTMGEMPVLTGMVKRGSKSLNGKGGERREWVHPGSGAAGWLICSM
jgi:hypothetical protein